MLAARAPTRKSFHAPCGEDTWQQAAAHCRNMGKHCDALSGNLTHNEHTSSSTTYGKHGATATQQKYGV